MRGLKKEIEKGKEKARESEWKRMTEKLNDRFFYFFLNRENRSIEVFNWRKEFDNSLLEWEISI